MYTKLFYITAMMVVLGGSALVQAKAADPEVANNKDQQTKPSNQNECVFIRSIYNWQGLDDRNLVVWAPGRKTAYHVTLNMPIMSLSFAEHLAFLDGNNDGRLCSFGMDAIAINDHTVPQRSTISTMTRLDDEGMAKLEVQYKIKLTKAKAVNGKKTAPKEPSRDNAQ